MAGAPAGYVHVGHAGPVSDDALGSLREPSAVAIDSASGEILVAEHDNTRIQRFDPDGRPLGAFGSRGEGPGQFQCPADIAIDPSTGHRFVADSCRGEVIVFDEWGDFLYEFNQLPDGDHLFGPYAVAIDVQHARVLVADGPKVYVFDETGTYVSEFGSFGDGPGQFTSASGIAIDGDTGNIEVADGYTCRVEVFDTSTTFLRQYSVCTGGESFTLTHIAIDPVTRNRIVPGRYKGSVDVFDDQGVHLFAFGTKGSRPGEFADPVGPAVDAATGRIFVADERSNRVAVFDRSGNWLSDIGAQGYFSAPWHAQFDPVRRRVLVADALLDRVVAFDTQGRFLAQFGEMGAAPGLFGGPGGITLDNAGHVLVSDADNCRVQIFDADDYEYRGEFGSCGLAPGFFDAPSGIAFDPSRQHIIVAEASLHWPDSDENNRIQIFDADGGFISATTFYTVEIDVNPADGHIFAGTLNTMIAELDDAGAPLNYYDISDDSDGGLPWPSGIRWNGSAGWFAIADSFNANIKRMSPDGTLLGIVADSSLLEPRGVTVDPLTQTMYVADRGTMRVEIFVKDAIFAAGFE